MESLFSLAPQVVASIPIAIGLVEVLKKSRLLADIYAPFASLFVGVGLVALSGATWQATIAQGLIIGLAASGLYSGTKSVTDSFQG